MQKTVKMTYGMARLQLKIEWEFPYLRNIFKQLLNFRLVWLMAVGVTVDKLVTSDCMSFLWWCIFKLLSAVLKSIFSNSRYIRNLLYTVWFQPLVWHRGTTFFSSSYLVLNPIQQSSNVGACLT